MDLARKRLAGKEKLTVLLSPIQEGLQLGGVSEPLVKGVRGGHNERVRRVLGHLCVCEFERLIKG